MSGANRVRSWPAWLAGALLVGATATLLAPSAAADENPGGVGITVTVSPAPDAAVPGGSSASSSGAGSGGSQPSPRSGTDSGGSTVVTGGTPGSVPTPTADEFDLGGVVFVSGVTSSYTWNIDPLAGELHAEFRVHNVSQYTIDSTAGFQLVDLFGGEITRVDGIRIDQLKPDESRVVDATLTGVGQWAFLTTHATFTPPETVGGTALTSLTRDGFAFVPPWFIVAVLVVGAATYGLAAGIRVLRAVPLTATAAASESAGLFGRAG